MLLGRWMCTVLAWVWAANLLNQAVLAQPAYVEDSITVIRDGRPLTNPATGGLNNPQLYTLDLYEDGVDDLVVFDRTGNTWSFFKRHCEDTCRWKWNPDRKLQEAFPNTEHWAVLARQPCNDQWLLFTATSDIYISVYRIGHEEGVPVVEKIVDTLKYRNGQETEPLYVNQIDIPGFADVDFDGDLDVLTFAPLGGFLEWFRNDAGTCGEFDLAHTDKCFGDFFESGITKEVRLDTCDNGLWAGGGSGGGLHAGSTVLPLDYDSNGLYDVVLGDLNFNNLNLLLNDGSLTDAHFFSQDVAFPSASVPVEIMQFPAAFLLDAGGDGATDLVAAPNSRNNSIDVENLWYYRNVADDGGFDLELVQKDFLVGETVDWGSSTIPAAVDANGDGLQDLVLGVGSTTAGNQIQPGHLVLYLRNDKPGVQFTLADADFADIQRYDFHNVAAAFGDLNGDGLEDLVVGNAEGKLYYAYNSGSPDSAVYGNLAPFSPELDIGSNAVPALADLNEDGLTDLVVGERNGNLNYFENKGSDTDPEFPAVPDNDFLGEVDVRVPGNITGYSTPYFAREKSEWVLYTGNLAGKVQKYDNISGNLTGAFHQVQAQDPNSYNLPDMDEGARSAPMPLDLNGNGRLDLIIGNQRGGIRIFQQTAPVGMEKQSAETRLHVAPNPAGDVLRVEHSHREPAKIQIFNMQGKPVYVKNDWAHANLRIDIAHLPAGVYVLYLHSDTKPANALFIKK